MHFNAVSSKYCSLVTALVRYRVMRALPASTCRIRNGAVCRAAVEEKFKKFRKYEENSSAFEGVSKVETSCCRARIRGGSNCHLIRGSRAAQILNFFGFCFPATRLGALNGTVHWLNHRDPL